MKSAKSHFHLESTPNKDGTRLIFFNLSYGYKEVNPLSGKTIYKYLRLSTQKRVHPDYWDDGKLKKAYSQNEGKTIKNRMDRMESVAHAQLEIYRNTHGKNPSPSELSEVVKIALNLKVPEVSVITLVEVIDSFIEENQKLTPTAKGRLGGKQIAKYTTVRNNLSQYQAHRGRDVLCSEFNKSMFLDYLNFLNDQYKSEGNPYGYMVNTMAKKANTLTAILRKLSKNKDLGLSIDLSDSSLRIDEVPAADSEAFISEHDLQLVLDANTLSIKSFENARNYIIVCALTSLRYEDMAHLHSLKVEEVDGSGVKFNGVDTLIRKPTNQSKKDFRTFIPILKPVMDVIESNDGSFPKFPANSSMNTQLKKFAKHLGLDASFKVTRHYYNLPDPVVTYEPLYDLITCHMGRDSFVTNLRRLGVNHNSIMNISHPERSKDTMGKYYDKTTMVDNAALLVNEINRVRDKTRIYRV